jgi:hypothetical protein
MHPVYLIDEKHIAFFKVGEQGRKIAGLLDHGPGRHPDLGVHFPGDYSGQCGFTETRGAIEQDVIQSLTTRTCGFDKDPQIIFDPLLTYIFTQPLGSQREFDLWIVIHCLTSNNT